MNRVIKKYVPERGDYKSYRNNTNSSSQFINQKDEQNKINHIVISWVKANNHYSVDCFNCRKLCK